MFQQLTEKREGLRREEIKCENPVLRKCGELSSSGLLVLFMWKLFVSNEWPSLFYNSSMKWNLDIICSHTLTHNQTVFSAAQTHRETFVCFHLFHTIVIEYIGLQNCWWREIGQLLFCDNLTDLCRWLLPKWIISDRYVQPWHRWT